MPKKEKKTPNPEDVRIGKNLVALRGEISQAELAYKMRSLYGLQWSQTTVWSVERGERPLRLSEAKAVASLLDVRIEDLLQDENLNLKKELENKLEQAVEQAKLACKSGHAAVALLVQLADMLVQAREQGSLSLAEYNKYCETAADTARKISIQNSSALRTWTVYIDRYSSHPNLRGEAVSKYHPRINFVQDES